MTPAERESLLQIMMVCSLKFKFSSTIMPAKFTLVTIVIGCPLIVTIFNISVFCYSPVVSFIYIQLKKNCL